MRGFKKLALLAFALSVAVIGCSSKKKDAAGDTTFSRAECIAMISDYFDWPHPTLYNDVWKAPLKQFNDVKTADTYGKQIETAYEEDIIQPDASGNFNPDDAMTRQDTAVVFALAFKISNSTTDALSAYTDSNSVSTEAKASVNAFLANGYMTGRTSTTFEPKAGITRAEAEDILAKITSAVVSPVQALPKVSRGSLFAPR
jgi:hypothetical protein